MTAPSQVVPTAPTRAGGASAAAASIANSPETSARGTASRRSSAFTKPLGPVSRFGGISDLAVTLAVLGIVLAMIMPMPSFLLDILISANITLSVIVLLVSMYITRPVEFSVFPTSLLLMTLFRLALNISSSRLILIHGNTGTRAAGQVIEAFGNFAVGGVVIFLVLIAIQYVVINQWRRAHIRGHCLLHSGRAAGQANVDRLGPERRAD